MKKMHRNAFYKEISPNLSSSTTAAARTQPLPTPSLEEQQPATSAVPSEQ